jgi:hypothetical protein
MFINRVKVKILQKFIETTMQIIYLDSRHIIICIL